MNTHDIEQHAAFENWARWFALPLGRVVSGERYESMETEAASKAWQAAIEADRQSRDCGQCVPLSTDGKSVFIDGVGEVPLDFGGQTRGEPVAWRVGHELFKTPEAAERRLRNPDLRPEPLYATPQPAQRVILDFDKIGSAGAFDVVNGRVAVPVETVTDLMRMSGAPAQGGEADAIRAAQTLGTAIYETAQRMGIANGDHSNLSVPQLLHLLDCMAKPVDPVTPDAEPVACLRRQMIRTKKTPLTGQFSESWAEWHPGTVEEGRQVEGLRTWQIRWLVDVAAQQPAEQVKSSLPYEQALPHLIDKIIPGLDSGDILADAQTASAALKSDPTVKQSLTVEPLAYGGPDADDYVTGWNDAIRAFGFKRREDG